MKRALIRQSVPLMCCVLAGLVITLALAAMGAFASPSPTVWRMSYPFTPKNRLYEVLTRRLPETECLTIATGDGLLQRTHDIRYYDAKDLDASTNPPVKRRSFLIELGWPNRALVTNARSIGLNLGMKVNPPSPQGDAALDDGQPFKLEVRWSALIFNAAAFSTVFMLLWAMLRPASKCAIVNRRMLASICIGFWLALTSAWGCHIAHYSLSEWVGHKSGSYSDSQAFSNQVSAIEPPRHPWEQFIAIRSQSIGFDQWHANFTRSMPGNRVGVIASASSVQLGWPMTALADESIGAFGAVTWPGDRKRQLIALTSLTVAWPGMLVNWTLFAWVAWIVLSAPGSIRRRWRLRRGYCPACAYPMGASPNCTECGNALPQALKSGLP